jgi:uncharacterized metal-binding protein
MRFVGGFIIHGIVIAFHYNIEEANLILNPILNLYFDLYFLFCNVSKFN